MGPRNLAALFEALKSGQRELNDDLPIFADKDRTNPMGVWSWDKTHEIRGTCVSDLRLVERAAAALGSRGGAAKSKAKAKAARANGAKGGRPKKAKGTK